MKSLAQASHASFNFESRQKFPVFASCTILNASLFHMSLNWQAHCHLNKLGPLFLATCAMKVPDRVLQTITVSSRFMYLAEMRSSKGQPSSLVWESGDVPAAKIWRSLFVLAFLPLIGCPAPEVAWESQNWGRSLCVHAQSELHPQGTSFHRSLRRQAQELLIGWSPLRSEPILCLKKKKNQNYTVRVDDFSQTEPRWKIYCKQEL